MTFRMTEYPISFRCVVKGLLGTVFGIKVNSLDDEVCPFAALKLPSLP